MTKQDAALVETFLRLKAKAAKGEPWTTDERAAVELSLEKKDDVSVLAACCVLVANLSDEFSHSVEVVRQAVERENPSPYVELSIHEALIYLETKKLAPFRDAVFSFVEQSLTRRAINLDNAIAILGRLARTGEDHAVALLRSLATDSNTELRASAIRVLQGLAAE